MATADATQRELHYRKRLIEIANQINAASSIQDILVDLKDEMLELASAERVTIFALDTKNQELFSLFKAGQEVREIRVAEHAFASFGSHDTSVAARTREAMLACEAAGFDVVIVETVGVGQSETAVAGMTDVFALLQLPNAGDDLQAIKRGIVELADIIVYNKTDLDPKAAGVAIGTMKNALTLLHPATAGWRPPVLGISATKREGIGAFWRDVVRCRDTQVASGALAEKRRRQALDWMWALIDAGLRERFRAHPGVRSALPACSAQVAAGTLTPTAAATRLLDALERRAHRA